MAKVKVRVLYPSAFVGHEGDEIELDAGEAKAVIAAGFAEAIGKTKATEPEGEAEPAPRKRATSGK